MASHDKENGPARPVIPGGGYHCLAPAKINLALHVTGRRDDGYHTLDSLVAFTTVGDRIAVTPSDELTVAADGPFAGAIPTDRSNLVHIVAETLAQQDPFRPHGARIAITKNLPVASGIGGGSADAAATARLLARMWHMDGHLLRAGEAAGADGPMCLVSETLRARGTGERLAPAPPIPPCAAVLVNPGVAVSTPMVFKSLMRRDSPALPPFTYTDFETLIAYLNETRNSLQETAITLAPAIADVLDVLRCDANCRIARMSGSGATCFGLFQTEPQAKAAANRIAEAHPNWWVVPTRFIRRQPPIQTIEA